MEPIRHWAAVEFTAQNGSTEALLTEAALRGLHPYGVTPLPGGFRAPCVPCCGEQGSGSGWLCFFLLSCGRRDSSGLQITPP